MLKTPAELLSNLGEAIRARRIALNYSQLEAARRAGIGVRTLRRMETAGQGTIESLINVAIALRCEDKSSDLFPLPPARSMDELLQQQRDAVEPKRPQRARVRVSRSSRNAMVSPKSIPPQSLTTSSPRYPVETCSPKEQG